MPNFRPNFQSPVTHLSAISAIWGTCSKQFEVMPRRKKASTAFVHNLGSWATGEVDLTSIRPDTPDDPDYESILALSEGLETASEDNMDPESDIEAIKASMKGFYQVFHPQQRCSDLLETERTKVCSLLLPLYIVRLIILFQKQKIGSYPPIYTGNSVRSVVHQKANSATRAQSVQDCGSHVFCNYFMVHFINLQALYAMKN